MPADNRVASPKVRDEGLGGCANGNSHLQQPTGQLQVGYICHLDDDRMDASPPWMLSSEESRVSGLQAGEKTDRVALVESRRHPLGSTADDGLLPWRGVT